MLNQFVYVGDVSGDTSPIIWQRVKKKKMFTPWVKVDQDGRPLPTKSLGILVGLTLKLDFLCIVVNVVGNIRTFRFVFRIF